jgi:PAS domain-containing protein
MIRDKGNRMPRNDVSDAKVLTEQLAGANASLQTELAKLISSREIIDDSEFLRAIVDSLPDYLFVKDLDSRFLLANKALAIDLGRTSTDELIGKPMRIFSSRKLLNRYASMIDRSSKPAIR